MELTREELLMKLGAARDQSRKAWRLVVIEVAVDSPTFSYRLDRKKLRQARRREGRYLLRTNLVEEDPAKLWSHYLLLVTVEEAFKNLKGDLAALLVKLLKTIEAVPRVPHDLAGLADVAELLGQLQHANLGPDHLAFCGHRSAPR